MKRHLRASEGVFIITLLITFLVCPGLYAAEEALPTPEENITNNIEAIGGKEALKNISLLSKICGYNPVPVGFQAYDRALFPQL